MVWWNSVFFSRSDDPLDQHGNQPRQQQQQQQRQQHQQQVLSPFPTTFIRHTRAIACNSRAHGDSNNNDSSDNIISNNNGTTSGGGLSFLKSVVAGGLAGVIEIAIMYPTDVAKTRAQLSTSSSTMIGTITNIVRNEGVRVLYRGVLSPVFAEAPKRATKFACNEEYKKLLALPDGSLPSHRALLAGAMAGGTETIVNCPFEMVKVRMQAKEYMHMYKSVSDCLWKVVRQEGVMAVYQGFTAHLTRNALWNGTYFAVIGTARNIFPAEEGDSRTKALTKKFLSGLLGGSVGVVLATPFDVVKSRMQSQLPSTLASAEAKGAVFRYTSVPSSLVHILKTEGLSALYKGLLPRLVRLGPGGGIMIVAFDVISRWLDTVF